MVGMKMSAVWIVIAFAVLCGSARSAEAPEQWAGAKWEYATMTYSECREANTFRWDFSSRTTSALHILTKPDKNQPRMEGLGMKLSGKSFPTGTGMSQETWVLNLIGELGWELVSIRISRPGYLDAVDTTYLFKRPRQ